MKKKMMMLMMKFMVISHLDFSSLISHILIFPVSDENEQNFDDDDDDVESSDVDDSDLLKRLDEKYGKLPAHSDDDVEDIDPTWTSNLI